MRTLDTPAIAGQDTQSAVLVESLRIHQSELMGMGMADVVQIQEGAVAMLRDLDVGDTENGMDVLVGMLGWGRTCGHPLQGMRSRE